ncbi:MAG: YwaF family protein [Clostridia bacterium]|nr:YwaF family protein [Clostridia bacterium]
MPGTMFTPLQFIFSGICIVAVIVLAFILSKREERSIRTVFAVLWGILIVLEITKIFWETVSGAKVEFEWGGILPLYPCSIFLYAMPFAIWGKGAVRYAACGYVCTLGLIGGLVNFVYPVNILSNYSCLSFSGFHTLFYHGTIVLCALVMLLSGYHSYTRVRHAWELLLPCVPLFAVSLIAHVVNFSPVNSDYMFFKLNSFIFTPIGNATPDWLSVVIVYVAYLIIHALPYVPFYVMNRKQRAVV